MLRDGFHFYLLFFFFGEYDGLSLAIISDTALSLMAEEAAENDYPTRWFKLFDPYILRSYSSIVMVYQRYINVNSI